jgi:hypothetical protein
MVNSSKIFMVIVNVFQSEETEYYVIHIFCNQTHWLIVISF